MRMNYGEIYWEGASPAIYWDAIWILPVKFFLHNVIKYNAISDCVFVLFEMICTSDSSFQSSLD